MANDLCWHSRPHRDMLAIDLLSLLGETAMRTDKGFEPLTLAVYIGHEEQHTRWVRRDDRRDLLEAHALRQGYDSI